MLNFEEIYDQHYKSIFNYCYRRIGDFDEAKDITSQTFLKAYLSINRFKWKGIPVQSWLYKIATNETNLFFRSKKYRPATLHEVYGAWISRQESDDAAEEKAKAELEKEKHKDFLLIQSALKELPLKYQEVLTLKYFEGMSVEEICQILNKKAGTVKSLLSRGISRIKEKLNAT